MAYEGRFDSTTMVCAGKAGYDSCQVIQKIKESVNWAKHQLDQKSHLNQKTTWPNVKRDWMFISFSGRFWRPHDVRRRSVRGRLMGKGMRLEEQSCKNEVVKWPIPKMSCTTSKQSF
jgi:hypothetical protein